VSETVDEKVLYEDEINQWWKRKKYAFPKVKEGTIIEYSYAISSPYNVHLRTWYFQHDIPVLHSKYKFSACPYFNYIVLRKGFMDYDLDTVYTVPYGFHLESKDYPTVVYEWELNDVPAFKDESFVPSDNEYKMKVEFQLESYFGYYGGKFEMMTTWEQLIEELLEETESFGLYISSAKNDVIQILSTLSLHGKTNHEKVIEILRYVRNNYNWDGYYGLFATQTKRKFIDSKSGNVADLNLFLHSLLTESGIESSPVLISTRSHGKVYYQYPFLNLFNYVAVMVTDETGNYYIDATDLLLPLGMLPKDCINEYGLQVKKVRKGEDSQFFPLTPARSDLTKRTQIFTINEYDNTLGGKINLQLDGYEALRFRHKIVSNGIESIYNDLTMESQSEIINPEARNVHAINEPLVLEYAVKSGTHKVGDKIFITPFPATQYKENNLRQQNRIYPVDYGTLSEEYYYLTLALPDHYKIDYIPESSTYKDSKLNLEFTCIVQNSEKLIQIVVTIKRDQTKYEPSDYQDLKAFYDMVVKSINENIVLIKM